MRQPARTGPLPRVVPVRMRLGDDVVSLFSTLTMLGSPADVTTQELRIEQFFPADDATDRWIRQLAARAAHPRRGRTRDAIAEHVTLGRFGWLA